MAGLVMLTLIFLIGLQGLVKLEAEMMLSYAMSTDFGVASVESYEDLPAFENSVKPLPSHPKYVAAMQEKDGKLSITGRN